jgi:crotonobetainyl-CoA:carnitine CoA-transferase CaiB-like acyl-CoA transferase
MHKPLEGIRVLEWGIFHAGPGATAILADMGAEVIKLEQVGTGDPCRKVSNYKNIDFSLPGDRTIFNEVSNRGKKSITLELDNDEGRQIAYNLVQKCDIFHTNLRRSTIAKLKMDYQTLSKINPRLIYASVTGFGTRGPDADKGSFDYQGQGRTGMMYCLGEPEMPPLLSQFGIVDQATAIMSSYQMVVALYMRDRFGTAQEIDVSILGTASSLLYFNHASSLVANREIPRHEQSSADPLRNYYQCQDGKWLVQNHTGGEKNWQLVCHLLGHAELGNDPRYNRWDKRLDRSTELVPIFNQAFATKPRDEWLRIFGEHNLVAAAVNTVAEATNDPQMMVNNYVVEYDHPDMGHIRIPGFPMNFSQAEINYNFLAPKLGADTESVLKEIGGYSDKDIAQLREKKII